eukprot:2031086-Rhodomonas_salina.1
MGIYGSKQSVVFPAFAQKLQRLDGKVVAITGCTSGTGFVAAKLSAEKGASGCRPRPALSLSLSSPTLLIFYVRPPPHRARGEGADVCWYVWAFRRHARCEHPCGIDLRARANDSRHAESRVSKVNSRVGADSESRS